MVRWCRVVWLKCCGPKPPYCPVVTVPMVSGASGEKVHAQLRERRAIHFRELHLQQHFLRADGPEGQNVDDVLE